MISVLQSAKVLPLVKGCDFVSEHLGVRPQLNDMASVFLKVLVGLGCFGGGCDDFDIFGKSLREPELDVGLDVGTQILEALESFDYQDNFPVVND